MRTTPVHNRHSLGVALALTSAVTFGATGVLAKTAFDAGADVATLLATRFALAAVILWALVAWRRPALPPLRVVTGAFALGAIGYAGEALLYFSALERLDASLVSLLLASYPALVVIAAIALGRERPDARRALALTASLAGTALVIGSASLGALSGAGLLLAAASAVAYATYTVLADAFTRRVDGLVLAALVITGAAAGTLVAALARGSLDLHMASQAWIAVGILTLLCTVVPITAFLLALPLLGPGTASILSTLETFVGVGLAALLLHDPLGVPQVLGGALVVGAAVLLQTGGRVSGDEPAAESAPVATARPVAVGAAD